MNKKKYRYLKSAITNPETGISTVIINTELGQFTGEAKCGSEDLYSKFFGCGLAEQRAWKKYYNLKVTKLKAQLQILKDMMADMKKYASNTYAWSKYIDKYNQIQKELQFCMNRKDGLFKTINDSIESRDKELAHLERLKNKKQREVK